MGRLDMLKDMPPPGPKETIAELWHLVDLGNTVTEDKLTYLQHVDEDLYGVMSAFLADYGISESAARIRGNLEVYDPIVDYLKYGYNRPRPFQTAAEYRIPMFPKIKTDASDASYPSGHTLHALWFRHMYMRLYPDLATDLMKFVLDIKQSREEGGVHYPSDGHFSFKIYHHLKDYL
jgi:hypothetical protein